MITSSCMGHTLLSATHWPELSYQTPLTQGEMEGVKPGYDPRGEGASRSVTSSAQESMAQLGAVLQYFVNSEVLWTEAEPSPLLCVSYFQLLQTSAPQPISCDPSTMTHGYVPIKVSPCALAVSRVLSNQPMYICEISWGAAHPPFIGKRPFPQASTFPGGSVVKNPPANTRDMDSIPGSGRSPGEGNGNALQYFCLGNPKDRGAWWAIESMGSKKIGHDLATKQQHNKSIIPQNLTTDVGQCDQTPTKQQAMWGPCLACTSCVSGT